jgi:hypothetical protein
MKVCPFLGKVDDPETPILYPSEFNGCSQGIQLFVPVLDHQQSHCLSNYEACPAFLDQQQVNTIPAMELPRSNGKNRSRYGLFILFLIIIGLGMLLIYRLNRGGIPFLSQDDGKVIPTTAFSAVDSVTVTASMEASASPIPSATHQPTKQSTETFVVPSSVPIIGLETPIGTEVKLIIHKLRAGESFEKLERQYGTTVEAIKWVNYNLPVPLWADWLIVIPVNTMTIDPSLPAFQAYQVPTGGVIVEDLVQEFGVQEDLLLFYNDLFPGQVLPYGYWVLIPHDRKP